MHSTRGQLGGGVELAGLNGADGLAGHAHQLGQVSLGQTAPARATFKRFFKTSCSSMSSPSLWEVSYQIPGQKAREISSVTTSEVFLRLVRR